MIPKYIYRASAASAKENFVPNFVKAGAKENSIKFVMKNSNKEVRIAH